MKRTLAACVLLFVVLIGQAEAACSTHTYWINGKSCTCTTCCYGNNCNTTCTCF